MRRFSVLLLVVALGGATEVAAQTGTTKPVPPPLAPGDVVLVPEEHRVTFAWSIPQAWERRGNVNGMTAVAVSPRAGAGDRFQENANVTVTPVAPGTTLEESLQLGIDQVRVLLPSVEVTGREAITVGALPGYRLEMAYTFQGLAIRAVQHGTIHDGRSYVLTVTGLAADFDAYADTFERVLGSFRVGP